MTSKITLKVSKMVPQTLSKWLQNQLKIYENLHLEKTSKNQWKNYPKVKPRNLKNIDFAWEGYQNSRNRSSSKKLKNLSPKGTKKPCKFNYKLPQQRTLIARKPKCIMVLCGSLFLILILIEILILDLCFWLWSLILILVLTLILILLSDSGSASDSNSDLWF